ncbi:bifunctional folylpolyglutamate synthase/dihydrofolate synthase [Falsigemmobacter intermedius]|uniref:Dihydrofolate synthase/folylpolyglutamate synthase n=1 Tax=Falsigemmobacter intermedius TaxID=1553448 RepID=A0A444M8Z7_9RHOB|nr:folylpolyglutamate synthase/dihydrofolate synthase family protein [Falsigemmobacter intermedius]RWY39140.1 bifunctional folylpolyglutamate synthase/dihydrofolate synthase [Falsigemmobacter intermedius]
MSQSPASDELLARLMSLHPKVIDLSLDRIQVLLDKLGNPERRLPPVIHLAGTNGKGSTQAMIRAGLEAAGKKVHAYTSPHLARFHERIRVAGELISEPELAELLAEVERVNAGDPITFFEITTCTGFLAFSRIPADYLLLEVGLGGRFDATNVIADPALCVITPVSLDHQMYLGDTVGLIATEKAGILKRRVPAVIGPQTSEGLEAIEAVAERLHAPLMVANRDWQSWSERGRLIYQDERGLLDLPLPNLPGPHQIENAGAAIAALRHLGFDEAACEAAVTKAFWPARMQRLKTGPLVDLAAGAELWLDGGHNPAAGIALAGTLAALPKRPTHAICGMLNTKDIGGFLRPLAPHLSSLHAVSIPGETATLDASETAAAARAEGIEALEAESVTDALRDILAQDPSARVVICGSLYLAGNILRENG